jgi:hypothetical protein
MFKFLSERQSILGAGFHTEAAERAHPQVVDVFIDDPHLFSIRAVDPYWYHFDGSVRAIQFTDAATGAPVMVVFIVWHDYFAFEPFIHFECLPVLRVLLRYDLPRTEKIFAGHGHSYEKGFYAGKYICEILKKAVHSLKMPTH